MAPRTTTKTTPTEDPTTIPIQPGFETWKNVSPGTVVLNRLGEYGKPRDELVRGGMSFVITPQERRLNQGIVSLPEFDNFTNGTLQPLSLLEDEFDTAGLRTNPNTFDEIDMEDIFKIKGEAFRDRLESITNLSAITRLSELAREPRFACTVQQYELIKLRERFLIDGPQQGTAGDPEGDRKPRPVTPR